VGRLAWPPCCPSLSVFSKTYVKLVGPLGFIQSNNCFCWARKVFRPAIYIGFSQIVGSQIGLGDATVLAQVSIRESYPCHSSSNIYCIRLKIIVVTVFTPVKLS
jgi:hypothetical protein